ncbi:MAG: ABC transporter substrate-binding protein [Chloroflexi bacterium]|nr:ABC transporter substrate-binding protein [Chloroflexota bacterium]
MHKIPILRAIILITIGALLVACAKPAPSPTPTTAPKTSTPTSVTTPTAKASPTPTQPAAETPRYGGVFRPSETSARSLIPEPFTISVWWHKMAHDTLLQIDEKGELKPNLATDWKLGPDMKSLTLTLRKGVKFHDGTDFNAAAVKWNIELRKAAKVGDYETVTSIDVIDDYTVRLNLSKFQNTLLTTLWFIGGLITSPTTYQKLGRDAAQWQPVGTGPFKFVSHQKDVNVRYERFDGYWQKGKPYLDAVDIQIILDSTTNELAFKKGDIHVRGALSGKTNDEMTKEGWQVVSGPVESYSVFFPDSANASSPFANKKVREAVEYAIDKENVVKALGYGRQQALYQMTPNDTYAYISDLPGRRYDPAKAKQLLAEAGYPSGFKATLITRGGAGTTPADALVAAATQLKAVGIDATIDNAEVGRFTTLQREGWKNGLIYGAVRIPPDWLQLAYTRVSTTAIDSISTLKSPGLQELLEQALAAPDTASKKTASQQVVRKIYDEAMVMPLWGAKQTFAAWPYLHNIEYHAPWGPSKLWGPADIWLSK